MDIDEVRQYITDCEANIGEILNSLHSKTGLKIETMEFDALNVTRMEDARHRYKYNVNIEVRL